MKKILDRDIEGIPVAQPRPKASRRGGFIRMYTPDTADLWKSQVAHAFESYVAQGGENWNVPLTGPLRVDIDFYLPRPGNLNRKKDPDGPIWRDAKPDVDNLVKACLDAISDVGLWGDDAQVCSGLSQKFYCARGQTPGAIITIYQLDQADVPVVQEGSLL